MIISIVFGCECLNYGGYFDLFYLGRFKFWRVFWRRRVLRLDFEDLAFFF